MRAAKLPSSVFVPEMRARAANDLRMEKDLRPNIERGDLKAWFAGHAPAGPWHYPEDQITDAPLRQLAAEITREKLYERLHQELPYQSTTIPHETATR